jgi:hypothetical protein
MTSKNDRYMIEHRQHPLPEELFARQNGPRPQGIETFGWFTASSNYSAQRRFTITRPFHGPRRTR